MSKRSGVGLLAIVAAVLAMVVAPQAPVALADAAGGGGDYVQLGNDAEVLDTRDGTGGATGKRAEASTTTFPVLGVGGVPTTGVGSVMVRVAALAPTENTFLVLWPDGTTRPGTTALSVKVGEDLSTFTAVKVGANGRLAVYNAAGAAHVVVEVHGYFKSAQGTNGGGFVPVAHTRTIDTRSGLGTSTGTIAAGASRTVTLTGGLIPAGASAAYVNLAVPGATDNGWFSYQPSGGTARPVMNFMPGTTQQAAVVQLPADGKVTFKNNGATAVHFMLNVEGYFTNSATTGSGFRSASGRLINTRTVGAGLPVNANSTIDVQVGGTYGLPTRGIAGTLLTVIATSEASGYLKAWPVGETEPSLTMMDHGTGWRANSIVLKPGTDGRIRIRNGSSGTIHLIVDLQGWFAEPLPAAPVVADTPTTVFQGAPIGDAPRAPLDYAYTDNAGRIVHGHQDDLGSFNSTKWAVISGNEAFSGRPAITQRSDGRLQITARNRDGDVWSTTQTTAGGLEWDPWVDLGGSMAGAPSAGRLADGTPVQFAVDADGKLWSYQQSGAVPYWRNLGDQDLVGDLTVVTVRDGLRVFGMDGAGVVKTVQLYNDTSLSPWTNLGGAGSAGPPAVVVRPGYQLQVFVRGPSGAIVTKLQDAAGTWPTGWTEFGTGTVTPAGPPAAVLDPTYGRVLVVVRGTDGENYKVWETAAGSNTFGQWSMLMFFSDPTATDPTALSFYNGNGASSSSLVVFRSPNGTPRYVVVE